MLIAVPGGAVAGALNTVQGIGGKTVIDATNLVGTEPPSGCASNKEFVKSRTNGPTAKSFNLNFANQYCKLREAKSRPNNLWSGDDEARPVVEQLNRDAGYEPVRLGGLDKAATQEHGPTSSPRYRRRWALLLPVRAARTALTLVPPSCSSSTVAIAARAMSILCEGPIISDGTHAF